MNAAAGVYEVELLYEKEPIVDAARVLEALRARLGEVDRIKGLETDFSYVVHEVQVALGDVQTSVQVLLSPSEIDYDPAQAASSLDYTWDWPGARYAVTRARHSMAVSDFLGRRLPPAERLRLIIETVRAVASVVPPLAVDWKPAQKIVDPRSGFAAPTLPFNVRYFTFPDQPGRALMDTRGLDVLGLPDVQCSFVSISPRDVAAHLYGIASTLVMDGPLEEGHVVPSADGRRWVCRRARALVPPDREVLVLTT